ncbi:MAG: 50S ribosomal protein L25 [Gemmatimonadetes bacterium]|nr:50S ribosomal protein L25 [Gemmatimonadota bacterium]
MATQVTLKAGLREGSGKGGARKLRAQGQVPAIVYGAQMDPMSLVLSAHEAGLLFHSISVENTIVNLEVEGDKTPLPTLVREIQTHPYRPQILHVDFLRIQSGVEVELEVPVHVVGIPKGVKDDGGVLDHPLHNLPIRCVPDRIPEEILVDVTALGISDAIHVSELTLPEGVTAMLDGSRIVCSVQPPSILAVVEPVVAETAEPGLVGGEAKEGAEGAEKEEGEGKKEGKKEGGKK